MSIHQKSIFVKICPATKAPAGSISAGGFIVEQPVDLDKDSIP